MSRSRVKRTFTAKENCAHEHERKHRDIGESVSAFLIQRSANAKCWHRELEAITFALNTDKRLKGVSPAELLHGFQPRFPADPQKMQEFEDPITDRLERKA